MATNKTPIEVQKGTLYKGMKMFRQIKECKLGIDGDFIHVTYIEWLESPSGEKVELQFKSYIVKDEPEISKTKVNGEGEEEKEIIAPAKTQYTKWAEFEIMPQLVGAKLGNDIIIKSIRETLAEMSFDAPDGYITQP